MRLLLANCLNFDEGLRSFESFGEQLGLLYLASSLKRKYPERDLQTRIAYSLSAEILNDFKPDIVGLSSVSQNYHVAQKYAKSCRELGIPVMIGGVHISSLPHTLTKDMDVGVINEGEEAICELMEIFAERKAFPSDRLSTVKGIVFFDGNQPRMTEPRGPIKELDTLPIPARELFCHPRRGILTSRGCPYDCTFCFSKPFWGKPRFFSPEYVIKEIEDIYSRFKPEKLAFYDDLFVGNIPRFRKIVEYVRASGLHKKMEFSCNVRPNLATEEVADLLKSMHITSVFMGIESGNDRVLRYLKKSACSVEQNWNAVKTFRKRRIVTYGGFIIGSPDETREEIMDTLHFVRKSGIDVCWPLLLTPLPGTPVWDYAMKRGLVSDHMDWSILREEFDEIPERNVILSETLSREELHSLYMKFKLEQKRQAIVLAISRPIATFRNLFRLFKVHIHFMSLALRQNGRRAFSVLRAKWRRMGSTS